MTQTELKEHLQKSFLNLMEKRAHSLRDALKKDILKGAKLFKSQGLPTKKNEDWKYTNILPYLYAPTSINPGATSLPDSACHMNTKNHLVFINGDFKEALSTIGKKMTFTHTSGNELQTIPVHENATGFEVLPNTLMDHYLQIDLGEAEVYETPIVIHHLYTDGIERSLCNTHIRVNAPQASKASILEIHENRKLESASMLSFSNVRLDLDVNSSLEYVVAQTSTLSSTCYHKITANVSKGATLKTFNFTTGNRVTRNEVDIKLIQDGATAESNGLYALRGEQHCDNHINIHHLAPHTTSNQLFKSILDGNSHGIFTGHIVVHRDAQLVNSSQLNKNLLLSKKAHADTRPQLEVYADDVKCGHGATVGRLSEDEIFYLESRGIPKKKALKVLSRAFSNDALEKIDSMEIRSKLATLLYNNFEKFTLGGQLES